MPLLPAALTKPLWVQFSALFNEDDRPEYAATHPRGCHRRPIPTGSCSTTCSPPWSMAAVTSASPPQGGSDRTIRRRLLGWTQRDVGVELLKAALAAYNQMIGLDLDDLSSDGSITNRPAEGNFRVDPRSTWCVRRTRRRAARTTGGRFAGRCR